MLKLSSFLIKFFNEKIGIDQFGNIYYTSNDTDYLGRKRRFVTYKGLPEPSKVPPLWHAWLHHLSDVVPGKDDETLPWQKEHLPNLTGTKYSYDPYLKGNRVQVSADYQAWQPKNTDKNIELKL